MKIECDKCSAKYSIADEKVRGKTFKIRCKKCSNVIIVRDKAAADGALGGDDSAGAVGWHLAINGETVGPMAEDEVRQRFRGGEIDRDTAVWQEGFEDWVPLGDVDTFADLAASAGGGAAADPFASANQEDYAAAAAMHAGVAAAPVAAAPVAARAAGGGMAMAESPSSPRVTRLTGQRNENSVLFSLDSLQALATGGGGSAHAPRAAAAPSRQGPRGLATVAPSSEGSGLIDIRALGAMVGSDAAHPHPGAPTAKSVDDAALPSFGGANLGGLASTPLTPQVAAVDHMGPGVAAAPRSNAPIYVLMVLLLLVIVGLAAYVLMRKPEQVIVEKTVAGEPAPSVKGAGADDDDDDDKDKKKKDDEEEDEDAEKAEGEVAEGEAAEGDAKDTGDAASKSGTTKKSTSSSKSSSSSSSKPSTSSSSSSSSTKPTPAPSTSGSSSLDVDCILDPNLPKCKGGGSSKPSSGGTKPAPAPADPSLPATLTTADIKAGVAPVKDAAKSCGAKHGAKPGEKVKVKLSISGATGSVSSASAEPPHQGTPLGNCVAAALKKASFKKFQKPSLGAVYPVSM